MHVRFSFERFIADVTPVAAGARAVSKTSTTKTTTTA